MSFQSSSQRGNNPFLSQQLHQTPQSVTVVHILTLTQTLQAYGIEISHSTHMASFNAHNRTLLQALAPKAKESSSTTPTAPPGNHNVTLETSFQASPPPQRRLQFSHLAQAGTTHMASFNASNRALLQALSITNPQSTRQDRRIMTAEEEARNPRRNAIISSSDRQRQIRQDMQALREREYDELNRQNINGKTMHIDAFLSRSRDRHCLQDGSAGWNPNYRI
ncbi:hypothetical protein BJ508DRAFT_309519 [Ascobolus immersus RN42]|uniref:Uncharacterized protein n=1 Tax=Ascobolus immersus RN42 TaxID=1160509 RepID=A0A3N4HWH8_ASCIM|nr:hypothetical protein BJ508DRAFT_309519 [Ascobolus immersus RN42]